MKYQSKQSKTSNRRDRQFINRDGTVSFGANEKAKRSVLYVKVRILIESDDRIVIGVICVLFLL